MSVSFIVVGNTYNRFLYGQDIAVSYTASIMPPMAGEQDCIVVPRFRHVPVAIHHCIRYRTADHGYCHVDLVAASCEAVSRRINDPTIAATSDPARMPTFASTISAGSVKASPAMNSDIVKPIPPSHATP
jgi:hypothetical protein